MRDEDILSEAKEAFELAGEREAENRASFVEDIRFGRKEEQWDPQVKAQRIRDGRPCLTVSKLAPTIRQVVNDARQNKPEIKVQPQDSQADPETADILSGLIRNIELSSDADVAYDTAIENAVAGGFGYFRINTEYACDDTFDQDIVVEAIPNPLSVFGDPYSQKADNTDWNTSFVVDLLSKAEFKRRFRGAEEVDWDGLGYGGLSSPWIDGEQVQVAEYWTRDQVAKKIVGLTNGEVVGLDVYEAEKEMFDRIGASVIGSPRTVKSYKVTQYLMTGAEILEKVDWAGRYIPIIPVYGDTVHLEGVRYHRSLIRSAIDAQRMSNFQFNTIVEQLLMAPKAPFIGPKGSFKSDASKWNTANSTPHSFIEYDVVNVQGIGPAPPPQRQGFAGMPAGDMQALLLANDTIKQVTGIYDASLGAKSNETSGRAIRYRQMEGDVSTFHFIDNLTRAIRAAGRTILDLVPHTYNSERVIRVLGRDGKPQTIPLKTPVPVKGPDGQPQVDERGEAIARVFDLAVGKYDVVVTAGPSYTTRREEVAAQMQEFIRAYPQAAPLLGDLMAHNMDWPGADEIERRLKALLPPPAQGMDPQVQAMQQQLQQLGQELAQAKSDRDIELKKLEIASFEAETDRMKIIAGPKGLAMTPEEVQALVLQTLSQLATPGDLDQPPAPQPQFPEVYQDHAGFMG
jgi:hypothetical protein